MSTEGKGKNSFKRLFSREKLDSITEKEKTFNEGFDGKISLRK